MLNTHLTDEHIAFAATLPNVELSDIYHVGTLNQRDKGQHGPSLEGDGLSISQHPDDWRCIAQLGGQPTWTLTKPGNRFVSYWALTPDMHTTIAAWSNTAGYTRNAELWIVTYSDEDEETWTMTFTTEAEAHTEAEHIDGATVRTTSGLVATPTLHTRMGQHCRDGNVADLSLVAFIGDLAHHCGTDQAGIDGIWWADRYDPTALSCPRGVIVPTRVATFQRSLTHGTR